MVVSSSLCYWIIISLVLLSSSGTEQNNDVDFSTNPSGTSIDRGGSVSFTCTFSSGIRVNISWNGPGVEAGIITSNVTMDANTSTLTITNVNMSHAGGYFCTARDDEDMDINSKVANLTVNYMAVKFTSDVYMVHENQSIIIDANVTVFGSLSGDTSLMLHSGEGRSTLNQLINRTEIQDVQIPDKLNCTNSTIQVTVTTDDPLVVLEGNRTISIHIVPIIGFEMTAYSVMEGDNVTVCVGVLCGSLIQETTVNLSIAIDDTAEAGTDFIVAEQLNITLNNSSRSDCVMIMTVFDEQSAIMDKQFQVLLSASTESDSPIYMPNTTIVTIINLPLPTIMPSETKVSTGKTAKFEVNASFPVEAFQWQHNNENISDGEKYSGTTASNLMIMNIGRDDGGNYSCIVTTDYGLDVSSQQAQLKVFALPVVTAEPVNITVNINETDLVFCNVTIREVSDEEFTYQWQRNGSDLMELPGKFEGVNTSMLTIINAQNEDEDTYQCVIYNGAGDSVRSDEVFLSVVDLPAIPMITNVSASSTSITITWKQNLSSDDFWYELRYNFTIRTCENYTGEGNRVINSSFRSFTLENTSETPMEEDSIYSILLIAVNSAGRSEASVCEISTQRDVPTGAPKNLTESFIDDRTITIQWETVDCSHRNGEITGYSVTYYPAGQMLKTTMTNISNNKFTARGLVFDTEYVFEVLAINSYGFGPPANKTLRTSVIQGIVIVYDNRSYQNNSIVNLDTKGGSLQCFTDKDGCCSLRPKREGEWIYPNGSMVQIRLRHGDFYRTRGANPGVVSLIWTVNALIPNGVFCCEIPPSQIACIGVYPKNEGIAVVLNIIVDPIMHGLVCTSTGGPATTVIWKVNSKMITDGTTYHQNQRIVSKENATFENILYIPTDSIANYNATYECIVMNSAGNDSMNLALEAIQIVHGNMSVGDNSSLLCKSNITVDAIEWLNSNGEVIVRQVNIDELSLIFAPVNISINNQVYTCRVNKSALVNKSIVVSVTVEDPLMVMIDGPNIITSIGERVTINCTATAVLGVTELPILTLTHPNGMNFSTTEGRFTSIVLDPVHIEDAGEYTCTGVIHLENITSVVVQAKQNFTFKLPTPKIGVAHYEGSLSVGSSSALNCTVKNYSIADFDVSVDITWLRSGTILSNNNDRVIILNFNGSLSMFISQLTLSPLSANDENITCSVTVYLATPNSFIEISPSVSKHVQLTIEDPNITVEITSTVEGDHQNLTAGTSFSLICMVDDITELRPEFAFEWMHSNGIDSMSIVMNRTNSSELHFSSLKLSDAGEYMCQVNIISSFLSSDLTLMSILPYPVRVIVPLPAVTATLSSQPIFAGSSPNVTCVAEFNDTVDLPLIIRFGFSVDGSLMDLNYDNPAHMESYTKYRDTFTINNIQADQVCACVLQPHDSLSVLSPVMNILIDQMNQIVAHINVSITASLLIEVSTAGKNIAGETFNLTCTVVIIGSSDVPNISWNSTVSTDTISYNYNRTYLGIVQFDPLQESHHDHYQCLVTIADITEKEMFNLTVQVPRVYVTINDSGATGIPVVGQPYTLLCSVSGDEMLDSSVTYQWIKYNDMEMQPVAKSGSLLFSSLNLSNSGNYSCDVVVSSSYLNNNITATSALVSIRLRAPSPRSVMLMSLTDDIFTGYAFSMACTVTLPSTVDIPVNVDVEWSEPVEATLNSTSLVMMESPNEYVRTALFVSDVQSETISFQCTASVSSNSSFITASENKVANGSIFIIGRPSQPIGLNASVGSTFINLTWSRRENDTVHGYELLYDYSINECQNNTGMMTITQISNTTNSLNLEHLEEDSEFNISLIAFNPAGRSEPATIMATTSPSAPNGAPQYLKNTSVNFTNVTIQWDPVECSRRNGRIDGYRLIYYPTVKSSDSESILINGSNINAYTIIGLQPRVNYTLILGAVRGNYLSFGEESRRIVQTSIPQAVGFLFHGKVYGNNSIVSLMEVGEGRDSLLCITSEADCCKNEHTPRLMREWYFPNGSSVKRYVDGHSFYRDRDLSIVRLNRRYSATSPNGIFQCIIPSTITIGNIMTKTIHIGIYDIGQGIPEITSFYFNRSSTSLNCTSRGGPVTTVTWKINNQNIRIDGNQYRQTQIIVDSEDAEYKNILYSNDASNLVGVFTCIVQNARGSDNKTISTDGVVIESIAETYTVGNNANITCRSDVATERIEWLRDEGKVIVSENNASQLELPFAPVNDSVHGQIYVCRVTRNLTDVTERNFTMKVDVPAANTTLNLSIVPVRDSNIAGESNSFICTVSKNIQGLKYLPRVVWVENDMEIAEQNVSFATLTFTTLNTSHGGVYTCQGNLSSPALSTPLILTKDYCVDVKIPTPSINVTLPGGTLYAGTNLSVVCGISIDAAVDSDISVNVTWLNGSSFISNGTERVFISPHSGAKPSFTSTLFIHPLVDVDNSNFTCRASIHSDSQFINQSNVGESSIQIPVEQRTPSASNIVIKNITSTGINLTWSQEAYDFIKGFNITATYIGPCSDFDNMTLISSHPSPREASIKGLQEFSNYSIVIAAFNDAGHNSSQVNIATKPSVPDGSPNGIRNTSVKLTSVTISWNPINCIEQNSIIHSYVIHYWKSLSESELANISTLTTMVTINNLDPRTKYAFEVQGINDQGQKGLSDRIDVTTSAPTAVGFLLNDSHSGNKSVVSLDEIGEEGDALVCLTNNFSCCEEMTVGMWYFPNSSQVSLGHQGSGHDVYVTRGPSLVRLHQRRNSMLPAGLFHCKIPDTSGINQSIYVGIYPDHPGAGAVMVENLRFDKRQQTLSCTSTGGPPTTVEWTKNGQSLNIDDITHSQTQTITDESTSMFVTTIFIHRRRDLSGIIGNYSCKVSNSRGTNQRTFEIQGLKIMGHESSLPHGSSVHLNCSTDLTADTIEWLDLKGKVLSTGNGSSLGLIHTPSDSNNAEYTCRVNSTFGSQNETVNVHIMQDVSPSLLIIPIIVIITVLAVVVIVIIVVIVFMRRKHQGKFNLFSGKVKSNSRSRFLVHVSPLRERSQDSKKGEHLVMTTYRKYKGAVVSMDDFNNYVKNMHDDRDQLFEKEYSTISKEPLNSYSVAEIMVNKIRNRFGNIFPYDHCRVKLKELAGIENSDYINASYLDGYQKPSAYIAAQGPLPNTLEDFWRMIWEKRLTTIVMLTQCFEGRKKCECYWPENINDTFEPGQAIKVVLTSTVPFSEYTIRKMTVTRTTEPELQPLEVIQFHFVAWPDHGVPDNCAVMLNFIRHVRKLHSYSNPCPLLVHCSAGVGRTGTFIVLDTMLERMKTEDTLNIYDYVQQLREQRVLMVQTLAQYMFIHDALKEYILCGQTEIIASDIRNVIDNLSVQHDPCSAASGFEHQFQILGQLQYVTEENSYSNATSEQNIGKNRYSNKLPNNFYRVRLKSSAVPGSDYINASFIHGYRQKKTYIATQGPLESTVCDFWRMVWENESKCVVLLSQLMESDKEMCCCYWPTTEGYTQTYGQITVKLLTEERYGYCDLRKFEIDEEKAGVEGVKTAFTVTQFHFLEWPEHETPPITSSLIELMGNVNRVQMGAASKPMIVMCNDGVGRTGTFICIHAQLERLKTEGVFDFFQFIKSARIQRAGLVSDSVQYVLCHEVLADYLDSFDTYANFKEVM